MPNRVLTKCKDSASFNTTLFSHNLMLRRFENWTRRVYQPKEAKWKRPVLLILSILVGIVCFVAGYTQIHYHWTNNGIWLVIGLFGLFSLTGFFVSVFGKDYWVALVLGRPHL